MGGDAHGVTPDVHDRDRVVPARLRDQSTVLGILEVRVVRHHAEAVATLGDVGAAQQQLQQQARIAERGDAAGRDALGRQTPAQCGGADVGQGRRLVTDQPRAPHGRGRPGVQVLEQGTDAHEVGVLRRRGDRVDAELRQDQRREQVAEVLRVLPPVAPHHRRLAAARLGTGPQEVQGLAGPAPGATVVGEAGHGKLPVVRGDLA